LWTWSPHLLALPVLLSLLVLSGEARAQADEVRVLLKAPNEAVLSSETVGRIVDLPVAEGGVFAAGDPLVRFDCATNETEHRRAMAELTATKHKLANDRKLARLNSIGTLEVSLSEAAVDKADAEAHLAALAVERCVIAAPYDGRVVTYRVHVHESVAQQQPLLEIVESGPPPLELFVPSRWVAWLTPGMAFQVRVDETGDDLPAHVTGLGARVDPVSQLLKIRGALDRAPLNLLPGMSGRAIFRGPS